MARWQGAVACGMSPTLHICCFVSVCVVALCCYVAAAGGLSHARRGLSRRRPRMLMLMLSPLMVGSGATSLAARQTQNQAPTQNSQQQTQMRRRSQQTPSSVTQPASVLLPQARCSAQLPLAATLLATATAAAAAVVMTTAAAAAVAAAVTAVSPGCLVTPAYPSHQTCLCLSGKLGADKHPRWACFVVGSFVLID